MTHATRSVAVAVLVALALCVPVQAQTPFVDAIRASSGVPSLVSADSNLSCRSPATRCSLEQGVQHREDVVDGLESLRAEGALLQLYVLRGARIQPLASPSQGMIELAHSQPSYKKEVS